MNYFFFVLLSFLLIYMLMQRDIKIIEQNDQYYWLYPLDTLIAAIMALFWPVGLPVFLILSFVMKRRV